MDADKNATILIYSTDMDKVLFALIIATGFRAMGVNVKLWFTMWGANCLKRRRSLWHLWRHRHNPESNTRYRRVETDTLLQAMVEIMNRGGPGHLPLSRLHLFGLGPMIFKRILKKKNIPSIEEFIYTARDMDIPFIICQICTDALALDINDLIIDEVEVKGVSQYMKDAMDAHYNIVL